MSECLIDVEHVSKFYESKKQQVKAVNDISLQIFAGETFGVVGESGCGKSTFGQVIGQLLEPTKGEISFEGKAFSTLSKQGRKLLRKDVQYVFQNAFTAFNPRHKVSRILEEPLIIQGIGTAHERKIAVQEMLELIGLQGYEHHYIHEMSGGQLQRIGIGRALILKPKFLILDEPVSALDVSIQAQILNLLVDLQQKFNLTYLFISHDLHVVEYISTRVAVMYLGQIVELATVEELYENARHPYTKALLSAVPSLHEEKEQIILQGELPNPLNIPTGCSFRSRCPFATDLCKEESPAVATVSEGHIVRCHYPTM